FIRTTTTALGGAVLTDAALGGADGVSALALSRPAAAPSSCTAGSSADLVLRRSLHVVGSVRPGVRGDAAVADGRGAETCARLGAAGDREVDLDGLVLAPGFIDIHSHTDLSLLRDPRADSKVRQGVTTEVAGQDGGSVGWDEAGFAEAQARYREQGI